MTNAGMHALWNPSRFTGITHYQTWEDALLDDDDITEHVRADKLVPINIGGDGAFQFLVRVGAASQAATLTGREKHNLPASGHPCVSQPLRLRFGTSAGTREHTPDFMAVTRAGTWLIGEADRQSFAAARELAVACGWRYAVAARWREHVPSTLDALSSQRRPLSDPLGLQPCLLAAATRQGARFGEVAAASGCEPVARAQLEGPGGVPVRAGDGARLAEAAVPAGVRVVTSWPDPRRASPPARARCGSRRRR